MIADRYYYGRLTTKEKQIYKDFYAGIKNCENIIRTIPMPNPDKVMDRVFTAIIADNPHIYYLEQTQIRYVYSPLGIEIHPTYVFPKSQIAAYNQQFQDKANEIVAVVIAEAGSDELKREKALYEYFAKNFTYDKFALNTKDPIALCKAHSLIGVFLEGKAVCEGFSKAFKFLMNAMDMKCIVVTGYADWDYASGHAWNIVKLNNKPYHVDVTWAISRNDDGIVWYDYLNVSDQTISIDHSGFTGVPKCNSDDLDFYKTVAPKIDNTIYLKNHIKQCLKQKEDVTTFMLVKGSGKCGISNLQDGPMLCQEAAARAHREAGGGGFQFNLQYMEKKGIYTIIFTYDN